MVIHGVNRNISALNVAQLPCMAVLPWWPTFSAEKMAIHSVKWHFSALLQERARFFTRVDRAKQFTPIRAIVMMRTLPIKSIYIIFQNFSNLQKLIDRPINFTNPGKYILKAIIVKNRLKYISDMHCFSKKYELSKWQNEAKKCIVISKCSTETWPSWCKTRKPFRPQIDEVHIQES